MNIFPLSSFHCIGELPLTKALDPKFTTLWFGGGTAVDGEVRKRFAADLEWLQQETPVSELASAATSSPSLPGPDDTLARVIVLDQFSRNIYRDDPHMFSADKHALSLARRSVQAGHHMQIRHPCMRVFLFMPFMHAEELRAQEEGLALFKKTWESEPENSPFKEVLAGYMGYMKKHMDIISRFGRFPHRNRILGRTMRPEEEEFLASGGDTFGTSVNKTASVSP